MQIQAINNEKTQKTSKIILWANTIETLESKYIIYLSIFKKR